MYQYWNNHVWDDLIWPALQHPKISALFALLMVGKTGEPLLTTMTTTTTMMMIRMTMMVNWWIGDVDGSGGEGQEPRGRIVPVRLYDRPHPYTGGNCNDDHDDICWFMMMRWSWWWFYQSPFDFMVPLPIYGGQSWWWWCANSDHRVINLITEWYMAKVLIIQWYMVKVIILITVIISLWYMAMLIILINIFSCTLHTSDQIWIAAFSTKKR